MPVSSSIKPFKFQDKEKKSSLGFESPFYCKLHQTQNELSYVPFEKNFQYKRAKISILLDSLMAIGSKFHNLLPYTWKLLLPKIVLRAGTIKSFLLEALVLTPCISQSVTFSNNDFKWGHLSKFLSILKTMPVA